MNLSQIPTGSGTYYSHQVPAGPLPYRYFVSAPVYWSQTFPGQGTYTCRQTWADYSRSAVATPGAVISDLNTTLEPWGPAGCS